jgi:hypothetical protein
MRILTLDEGKDWLANRSLHLISSAQPQKVFNSLVMYEYPKGMGQAIGLVKGLAMRFALEESQFYLWIRDWSAYPSHANMDLFYGYRKSLSEGRYLIDAPFHIIEKDEIEKLESLLGLCVYFLWDSIVGTANGSVALSTSNDEVFDLYANDSAVLEDYKNIFSYCELEKIQ